MPMADETMGSRSCLPKPATSGRLDRERSLFPSRVSSTIVSLYDLQVTEGECINGCLSCPEGNEALGLSCELIAEGASRTQESSCGKDDEW